MASNDPGLAQMGASADEPNKGAVLLHQTQTGLVEEDRPVAPDQFDERYVTTRWEIWYI